MRRIALVLLALCMVLPMFAGGGQEEPADQKEEVVFIRNNGTEPQSLDPHHIEGVPEHNIYMCLFEGLVTYHPETLDPMPAVAESWESSNNGLTWTFHLRKDAKWSDGVPITAHTFVESWLRFLDPKTAAVYAYLPGKVIKGAWDYNNGECGPEGVAIRALDDYTFQFDLVGPAPYTLKMLPHYSFSIVPLHAIEKYGDEWIHPENFVGNGPYTLDKWIPHDKIVFTPNETYWDRETVKLDKVIFYPLEDENTTLNMYNQGDIDWIERVPNARLEEMKLSDDYINDATLVTYYYQFNQTKEPWTDARVRKALAMCIDRTEICDRITRTGEFPAYGITPSLPGYPALKCFKEDVKEAKKLLAEAGFPDGKGFPKFNLIYNTDERHKNIAEYCQQKWEEILGIECTIENQEWATFINNRQNQQFDVARSAWGGDYPDPNTFLQDLLDSESGNNDGKYANSEFDALLKKASLMPGGPERFAVLEKAERIAFEQDMAVIPFYHYSQAHWIDLDEWGGWYTNVLDIHPYKFIYKK